MRPLLEFCWLRIFPWIKLSRHSSMWDKPRWLTWFWKFLYEELSSFNPKGFDYSYAWSCSLFPFAWALPLKNSGDSYLCFQLTLLSVLLLSPLSITFFIFMHGLWLYFIEHRWGSLNQPICKCICLWIL